MADPEVRPAEDPQQRPAAQPEQLPADARRNEADEAAEALANTPEILLAREMKYIDKRFKEAEKAVEKIYDALPKAIADTSRAKFKKSILEKVLALALTDTKIWWKEEVRGLIKAGANATTVQNLREKYYLPDDKEGKSLMTQSIHLCDLYLHKMVENDGAITGNTLLKMLDSASQQAAIYVDLLRSGRNKDVIDALEAVLAGTSAGIETAMTTMEKRLETEFPGGKVMQPLWMVISFLPEDKRIELANKYKGTNPGQLLSFLEEGNKMGVFSPDEMQQILGQPLDAGKKRLYATLWTRQHRFDEAVERMGKTSYGSVNPVHSKLSLFGIAGLIAKGAAWGTIGGNAIVTGWVHMKGKGVLGAIGAIPKALMETAKVTAVKVAGAGLGLAHYWQKSKENPETKIPNDKENLRAKAALNEVKKGSGLWDEWDSFFRSGHEGFEGGKAFGGFVNFLAKEQKTFAKENEDTIPEKKLTAANFLKYLEYQSTKAEPDEKLDYAKLIRKFKSKLVRSDSHNVQLLAQAFSTLIIIDAKGYGNALDELPKLTV